MNVRTALISSALLLAVLGWACEQQGPASPSALGTPGGGSLGGVSLGAAGGAIFGMKKDCEAEPDDPRCKPKGGGGDTTTKFVAAFTLGDKTLGDKKYLASKTVISDGSPFPVDNKCNSVNSVDMKPVDVLIGGSPRRLTHLALGVKQCKTNYHVSVKVWVGWVDDEGGENNFATDYLPATPDFLSDGNTLHVHAKKAWFFDKTETFAFTLNIADIEYTAAP